MYFSRSSPMSRVTSMQRIMLFFVIVILKHFPHSPHAATFESYYLRSPLPSLSLFLSLITSMATDVAAPKTPAQLELAQSQYDVKLFNRWVFNEVQASQASAPLLAPTPVSTAPVATSAIKAMEVFTKAAEYMEIPIRRTDDEPLQNLFMSARSELNLDLKNIKQKQAKFWKQHPALVKTELLIQAQLTHESTALSPALLGDFKRMLELVPRLLEKLLKCHLEGQNQTFALLRSFRYSGHMIKFEKVNQKRKSESDVYGLAASNLVVGSNLEGTIQPILDMGGGTWDRDTVVRTLRAAYNNPERAVEYLYSPNVGKSALANSLHHIRRISAAEKGKLKHSIVTSHPGETKDISSLKIGSHPNIYLLDTPHILSHTIHDAELCSKLALTGAIAGSLIGQKELAQYFLGILNSSDQYKKWAKLSTKLSFIECKKKHSSSFELDIRKKKIVYNGSHTGHHSA
ncbi:hypothetical protein REPUB_Repub03eG0098400 [Reevesia pubescens]